MNPELAYFLKINVGIALFYAFYRLFFYKDTFFTWRRVALMSFLGVSLIYPLMNLQGWISEHEPMVAMADLYASTLLPEITVGAPQAINWTDLLIRSAGYLYLTGVLFFLLRFCLQLGSIIRLRCKCRTETIQRKRVYLLPQAMGPFSFFNWIFIHPALHTEQELDEILTHELTHVHQFHSADVLFSELVCIACWFNPFAWLIKREVRSNLEYLADQRVIKSGHNHQSYQFHLLGLAHQKAAANLSNSFNVLPLKNRIKMMNKKRTKEIGRSKYIMFLPLAALLMIVSNIETVARNTKSMAENVIQTANKPATAKLTESITTVQTPPQEIKKENPNVATPTTKAKPAQKEDPILEVSDEMPNFPGGMQGLMRYLSTNIKYPVAAHNEGRQGRVIVQFVVEKDGSISQTKILKSVSPDLDEEAIRVLSAMPNWTPGKDKGETVRVKYTVPVMYRLSTGKEEEAIKGNKLPEVVAVAYIGENTTDDNTTVFEVVEEMPEFPGGIRAMMSYLGQSIKYPIDAQKEKKQGRVVVSMIVDKTGKVVSPQVVQGVSHSLDAEAIRVVTQMPQWIPGKQRGETVNVRYTVPIVFRLQ